MATTFTINPHFGDAYAGESDLIVVQPLSLESSTPADAGSGVAVGSDIVLNFNEVPAAVGTITLQVSGGATVETFDLSTAGLISGTTVTLSPSSDLSNDESYDVVIGTDLQNLAGTPYLGETISFSTESGATGPTFYTLPTNDRYRTSTLPAHTQRTIRYYGTLPANTGFFLEGTNDHTRFEIREDDFEIVALQDSTGGQVVFNRKHTPALPADRETVEHDYLIGVDYNTRTVTISIDGAPFFSDDGSGSGIGSEEQLLLWNNTYFAPSMNCFQVWLDELPVNDQPPTSTPWASVEAVSGAEGPLTNMTKETE